MLGSIFGAAARLVAIPLDAVDSAANIVIGGDGSKNDRDVIGSPLNIASDVLKAMASEMDGK